MQVPEPGQMLELIRALPAGRPLLDAVAGLSDVHLVGGAVRDLLLGGEPFDLDLVVEGDPVTVARRIGAEAVVHDRFGTSTVKADGYTYDIGRARSESYARPGALPEVVPAGLEEDLRRRDFTMNTLAVALGGAEPGSLTAPAGALDDLDRRVLRVLHDASFVDDPTRLLRLARYRGRLGFAIEPDTRELAAQALGGDALRTVSGPRIGNELRLLARERDPVQALSALHELEVDRAIHPRFGLEDDALARRALALLPREHRRDRLALALAAQDLPPAELAALLDRLGFEAEDRRAIVSAAGSATELSSALAATRSASGIAELAAPAPYETVALAGAFGAEKQAREWFERLRHVRLEIDGGDLLAAGVPEGTAIGRGLRAALAAKLDGRAHGREEELAAALGGLEAGE